MERRTPILPSKQDRFWQAIEEELIAFEKRENAFKARERKERIARLGFLLDSADENELFH
jgi:hypothetical protein